MYVHSGFFLSLLRSDNVFAFFFFNDTATTEIYTLSLHDALPISTCALPLTTAHRKLGVIAFCSKRSEEHTSERQSRLHLVCRLLLEKKKKENHHLSSTYPPRCLPSFIDRHPRADAPADLALPIPS